jgi:hypothetical protein
MNMGNHWPGEQRNRWRIDTARPIKVSMSMAKGLAGQMVTSAVTSAARTMAPKTVATKSVDASASGNEADYSPMTS